MARGKKTGKQAGPQKKTSKRKRQRDISPQTEQPFEQDSNAASDNSAEPGSRRSSSDRREAIHDLASRRCRASAPQDDSLASESRKPTPPIFEFACSD